ncbi:diguanylate cyclase [Treponema sp. OttesenSCG-928-L16]|nr:diguanylate cyclase [Treponema sp. OttesenSCG-928-L16]
MKKNIIKKEYAAIGIIIALFIFVSFMSLTSIRQLQGNARVVNFVGIVRGATQKLIKEELMGYPDDPLIDRLESIVTELISGEGPNDLIVLQDPEYLNNMRMVRIYWDKLKAEIYSVRTGAEFQNLFNLSQEYFDLVDRTVFSAENFSERQVQRSITILLAVNGIFIAFIIVSLIYFLRSLSVRRRADALGKIAYIDSLTGMDNRASCERLIQRISQFPPENDLAVFMFDMNNLKIVNDFLGHQGGDRIITELARIIKQEGETYGFTGRYGGDEFIAVFEDGSEQKAETYLAGVNSQVTAYNNLHDNEIEKISYAAGYVIDNLRNTSLEDMINEADKRMYTRKRFMKGL